MRKSDDLPVWLGVGALGSVLLGALLIPFRELTSASNLAFAFLFWTVLVAELGGRLSGVGTAVISGVVLNFFLTEPFLTLAMNKRDDVIAFFALIACGFMVSLFGKRRRTVEATAGRATQEIAVLKNLLKSLAARESWEGILFNLKNQFNLKAIVFRDPQGMVIEQAPKEWQASPEPIPLNTDNLSELSGTHVVFGPKGLRLPEVGGRFNITTEAGVYSLDLWGNSEGFSIDERATLSTALTLLGLSASHRTLKAR